MPSMYPSECVHLYILICVCPKTWSTYVHINVANFWVHAAYCNTHVGTNPYLVLNTPPETLSIETIHFYMQNFADETERMHTCTATPFKYVGGGPDRQAQEVV